MEGTCPNCMEFVEFEATLLDCVTGQMGVGCTGCDRAFTSTELSDKQSKIFGRPEARL